MPALETCINAFAYYFLILKRKDIRVLQTDFLISEHWKHPKTCDMLSTKDMQKTRPVKVPMNKKGIKFYSLCVPN